MIAPFSDVFHPFHCRYFQSFINTLEFLFLISVIGRFLYITTYFYPFLLTYSAHLRSIERMQFVHVFFAHFSHFPLISLRILGVFHLIIINFTHSRQNYISTCIFIVNQFTPLHYPPIRTIALCSVISETCSKQCSAGFFFFVSFSQRYQFHQFTAVCKLSCNRCERALYPGFLLWTYLPY